MKTDDQPIHTCSFFNALHILLVFLFALTFPAEQTSYLSRNFSVQNGLPVNAVNDIVQDSLGYLYFATLNGMVRFDGYDFTMYNAANQPGIRSDRFAGMLLDSAGRIWLLTENRNITLYEQHQFTTFTPQQGLHGEVLAIKEDLNQNIWVASSEGLFKFGPEGFAVQHHPMLQREILNITPSLDGSLIGVSSAGLFLWDEEQYTPLLSADAYPIPSSPVLQVYQSTDGTIWVMGQGLFSYHPHTRELTAYQSPTGRTFNAWQIIVDQERTIVSTSIGYYNIEGDTLKPLNIPVTETVSRPNTMIQLPEGLLLAGDEIHLNIRPIFSANQVKTAFVDREGSIWVASETQGVFQLRPGIIENITHPDESLFSNVYSIIETQNGDVFAGSLNHGVIRFNTDGSVTRWQIRSSGLPTDLVRFLYEDIDGTVYLGLWNDGLWKLGENDQWSRVPIPVTENNVLTVEALHRSSEGHLYIGSRSDTWVYTNEVFEPLRHKEDIDLQGVRVIRETPDGQIIMGKNGGGLAIRRSASNWITITSNDGLPGDFIRDIFVESSDTLWLAHENLGLTRLILGDDGFPNNVHNVTTDDGLTSNALHRIIPDSRNNLWINSNNGVMRMNQEALHRYLDGKQSYLPVIQYNQQDGMLNPEGNGGVQTAGVLRGNNQLWLPN